MNDPKSFKDVLFGLEETRQNIESVQCGGWNENSDGTVAGATVVGSVPLPVITGKDTSRGLPGRTNNPLGDPVTGVGERSAFDFPDDAFGYSSACDVNYSSQVIDEDLEKNGIPGIKWQWDGDWDHDVEFVPNLPGVFQVNWGNEYSEHERWCSLGNDKKTATPRICEKLQKTLERLSVAAQAKVEAAGLNAPDAFCEKPAGRSKGYPPLITKRFCFDPLNTFECRGTSGATPAPDISFDADLSSSKTCRSPWYPQFDNKMVECHPDPEEKVDADGPYIQVIVDNPGKHAALSSSFFRHYGGDFSNWEETKDPDHSTLSVKTPATTPDDQMWKIRAECYEYYASPLTHEEEDPKSRVMGTEREQCEVVILSDAEDTPKKPEWKDGDSERQSGKQKESVKPDAAVTKEPIRPLRPVPDPWMSDPETNLSIVNSSRLAHLQRSLDDPFDITGIMSTILPTHMRASKSIPKDIRTDAFSDDGERAFSTFWESQQKELLKMTTDPATRLIMPARFLLGLADDDPIFQYVRNIISRSDGTVAVTLRSGPEDVINVLTSLLRAYVAPIQEVHMPVLIPLASEDVIVARIFEWKEWKTEEKRFALKAGRPSNDALADPVIAKLEQYIERLHAARLLRVAQENYLTKLLETQKKVRTYAADWYKHNAERLQQAAERGVQRRELRDVWREIQNTMLETDESQLNWCSNQRYSLAVYSLLDLPEVWWGDVPPYEVRDPDFLPPDLLDLAYEQPHDAEYDFSAMKFSREPLLIPALDFIEAEVKLPSPPLIGAIPLAASAIAALPTLPDADIFSTLTVPDVTLPVESLIDVPPPPADLTEAIRRMRDFADRMEKMRTAYSRFQPSFTDTPNPDQTVGNVTKIIHVENDLLERAARAFSRWMPQRKVDAAGRTLRLKEEGFSDGAGKCHEDIVCYFLPPEDSTKATWQWFVPESNAAEFTGTATRLRNDSLPPATATEDENPYTATIPTLRRLFPDFALPIPFDLTIPPPPTP